MRQEEITLFRGRKGKGIYTVLYAAEPGDEKGDYIMFGGNDAIAFCKQDKEDGPTQGDHIIIDAVELPKGTVDRILKAYEIYNNL